MRAVLKAGLVTTVLIFSSACQANEPFTNETSIFAISREDQANDLKTKRLKKEFTLSEAIATLTGFRKVTREQYLVYAHQNGAYGKVTLKGGKEYSWDIEPDYAATLNSAEGEVFYLLHPKLVEKSK